MLVGWVSPWVVAAGPEIYARPETSGELPELPIMLQPIPWVERKSGDFLKQKAPYAQVSFARLGSPLAARKLTFQC